MADRLEELQRTVAELSSIDPAVRELSEEVEGANIQMQELERSLADYLGELELDPEEAFRMLQDAMGKSEERT